MSSSILKSNETSQNGTQIYKYFVWRAEIKEERRGQNGTVASGWPQRNHRALLKGKRLTARFYKVAQ